MLKMNIEGAEYEVLKNCNSVLHKVQNLFVECHSLKNSKQRISEMLKILESNGFRYYMENVTIRKNPFINKLKDEQSIDLQINIFALSVTLVYFDI